MKKNFIKYSPLFFLSIIFISFNACKKDDVVKPEITSVSEPTNGQTYSVPSNIPVQFTANDNANISYVRLRLLDASLANVQSDVNYTINQKQASFSYSYSLYDIHLTSGVYYLQIAVGDGENETSKYVTLKVIEFPRYSMGMAVAMKNVAGNSTMIGRVDTAGNYAQVDLLNGLCGGFQLSNYTQHLSFASSDKDILKAKDISTEITAWAKTVLIASGTYYTGLLTDDTERLTYVSSYFNSQVNGYDKDGMVRYTIAAPSGYYPLKVANVGNYMIAEVKETLGSAKKVITYYRQTKTITNEFGFTGKDVVAMYSLNSKDVIIFSNTSGTPVLEVFDVNTNSSFSPNTLPNSKLLAVTRADVDNFILGFENGDVYKYFYSSNTLFNFLNTKKTNALAYDSISNTILLAEAKTVFKYDNATYAQQSSVLLSDTIIALQTWYNK